MNRGSLIQIKKFIKQLGKVTTIAIQQLPIRNKKAKIIKLHLAKIYL